MRIKFVIEVEYKGDAAPMPRLGSDVSLFDPPVNTRGTLLSTERVFDEPPCDPTPRILYDEIRELPPGVDCMVPLVRREREIKTALEGFAKHYCEVTGLSPADVRMVVRRDDDATIYFFEKTQVPKPNLGCGPMGRR